MRCMDIHTPTPPRHQIKNEFGDYDWPVIQDTFTGKRLVVIDDYSFDELCSRAAHETGRIRCTLQKEITIDESELYRK